MDFNKLKNKFDIMEENNIGLIEYNENNNRITLEKDQDEYFIKIETAESGILQFKHCLIDALIERIANFYLNQEGEL